MKSISCQDLGAKCDFVAKGETDSEVKKIMNEHAERSHRDMMANMSEEAKVAMDKKMDDLLAAQK